MGIDRRKFMKFAGLSALGLAGGAPLASRLSAQHGQGAAAGEAATGTRWAMVIDLKKCRAAQDCSDCVEACHRTHNVPAFNNKKDEVKWIWKESFEHAFHGQEHEYLGEELRGGHALLLCNHCDSPPCTKVCPTKATWRREQDGIVMMDWHRCIGCRYCVAACPYGSRSFNWRDPRPYVANLHDQYPSRTRGVVEKCTFCEERLAKGQLPACVEACKAKAIVFGDLEDPNSEVRGLLGENFSIIRKPELGTKPQVYYLL